MHVTVGVTVIVSVLQWQLMLLNAAKEVLVWHGEDQTFAVSAIISIIYFTYKQQPINLG